METSKKIALFSCHEDPNYGSMLQAYALAVAVRRLGFEAEYITYRVYPREARAVKLLKRIVKRLLTALGLLKDRNPFHFFQTPAFASTMQAFAQFHQRHIPATATVYYSNTIGTELPTEAYGTFLVGSDQLWSPYLYAQDHRIPYFLDFAQLPSRQSYATSLGTTVITEEYQQLLKTKLASFSHVSCREKANTDMLSGLLGRPVAHVLDPTLLLSPTEWDEVATEPRIAGDYILAYILGEKAGIADFANALSAQMSLPVYYIVTRPKYLDFPHALTGVGPDEFIGLIRRARYVVTDSYHGCLFCINYRVQFYAFSKQQGSIHSQDNVRILEFLQSLQLEERFQADNILADCDYNHAHELLARHRQSSVAYLTECLTSIEEELPTCK